MPVDFAGVEPGLGQPRPLSMAYYEMHKLAIAAIETALLGVVGS